MRISFEYEYPHGSALRTRDERLWAEGPVGAAGVLDVGPTWLVHGFATFRNITYIKVHGCGATAVQAVERVRRFLPSGRGSSKQVQLESDTSRGACGTSRGRPRPSGHRAQDRLGEAMPEEATLRGGRAAWAIPWPCKSPEVSSRAGLERWMGTGRGAGSSCLNVPGLPNVGDRLWPPWQGSRCFGGR